ISEDGTIYVAIDSFSQCRIRKISPDGIITNVAGIGYCRTRGDGGPAANAEINSPTGLLLSQDGSIYVSEWFGNLRRIRSDGLIETVVDHTHLHDVAQARDGA